MGLMEISVSNLRNYINDEEISCLNKVPVLNGTKNVHPLEEFLNEKKRGDVSDSYAVGKGTFSYWKTHEHTNRI